MKLGIACVYFFSDEDSWMLDLQLDEIARHTANFDFTVYAGANRLWPSLRKKLEARDFVQVVELPKSEKTGGPEHGEYLDALVRYAREDGCDYITTLDCDSFPVKEDWPALLQEALGETRRFAAVVRRENLDNKLPHPCGTFFASSFLADHDPVFWPSPSMSEQSDFQAFLATTGDRLDTGIGYGYSLWHSKEPSLELLRSNKRDLHFLMAGIYGDVFFHCGATSRTPTFARDYKTSRLLALALKLEKTPVMWRLSKACNDLYSRKNEKIRREIQQKLVTSPDDFYQFLRGL